MYIVENPDGPVNFGTTIVYLDQYYVQHRIAFISVLEWEFNLIKYIVTGEFVSLFSYQGFMMMLYYKYSLHKNSIDATIVVLYLTSITQIACIFYNLKLIQLINYCKTNTQVPISPKYKIHNYDVYSYNQHNQESQEESLP